MVKDVGSSSYKSSINSLKMANKANREQLEDNCSMVWVDRLSSLPYDTIVFILSLLPLKEAMATSILSRQWRHTWRLRRWLDLDFLATMNELQYTRPFHKRELILHNERCKLFSWADRLIEGSTNLKQFRLVFDLSVADKERLDSWLGHVVGPSLERLELVFIDVALTTRTPSQEWQLCYTLPFPGDLGSNNLKRLKLLKTHLVNVSGEDVAFLLRNCPLLEQVSVSSSHTLVSLEIVGTHPSFKCLEMNKCHELKSVVVRGSGVVCIKYEGDRIEGGFVLEDVPLLTQLWISPLGFSPPAVFEMFEPVLPQLHIFKIFYIWEYLVETPIMIEGSKMPKLKELVLGVGRCYYDEASLLPLINSIICGAPYLEKLVVEAHHQVINPKTLLDDGNPILREGRKKRREREREKLRRAYSRDLRTLEFVGYRGVTNHLEFITHFAENNAALESIIVDPRSFDIPWFCTWENRVPRCNIEDDALARECAKAQLNKYASSKINVKIL